MSNFCWTLTEKRCSKKASPIHQLHFLEEMKLIKSKQFFKKLSFCCEMILLWSFLVKVQIWSFQMSLKLHCHLVSHDSVSSVVNIEFQRLWQLYRSESWRHIGVRSERLSLNVADLRNPDDRSPFSISISGSKTQRFHCVTGYFMRS